MSPPIHRYPPPRWLNFVAGLCVVGGFTLAGVPADAKSAANVSSLDLRITPDDIGPIPAPPLVTEAPIAPKIQDQSVPETVGEIDQVNRPQTPNRRQSGTGPLGNITADDGMLKELLENKTIPLFRLSVPSPF